MELFNRLAACSVSAANTFTTAIAYGSERYFRSEEHTSELQSRPHVVCRLLLEKKNSYSADAQQDYRASCRGGDEDAVVTDARRLVALPRELEPADDVLVRPPLVQQALPRAVPV